FGRSCPTFSSTSTCGTPGATLRTSRRLGGGGSALFGQRISRRPVPSAACPWPPSRRWASV
ncbi:unnamed protein product, partial [Effrenium voratum]